MIKFKDGIIKRLKKAIEDDAIILQTSPKVTQALLNIFNATKGEDNAPRVFSTENGLGLSRDSRNVPFADTFTDADVVEESMPIEDAHFYKGLQAAREYIYVPYLRQVLKITSRSSGVFKCVDDDENIYSFAQAISYVDVKPSIVQKAFPKLLKAEAEAKAMILASNKRRGVEDLKVGDTVTIRAFEDMEAEFGARQEAIGLKRDPMKITNAIPGTQDFVFLEFAGHLAGQKFTVVQVLETNSEVVLSKDGNSEFKTLINPTTKEEYIFQDSIRFSKSHLIKE